MNDNEKHIINFLHITFGVSNSLIVFHANKIAKLNSSQEESNLAALKVNEIIYLSINIMFNFDNEYDIFPVVDRYRDEDKVKTVAFIIMKMASISNKLNPDLDFDGRAGRNHQLLCLFREIDRNNEDGFSKQRISDELDKN